MLHAPRTHELPSIQLIGTNGVSDSEFKAKKVFGDEMTTEQRQRQIHAEREAERLEEARRKKSLNRRILMHTKPSTEGFDKQEVGNKALKMLGTEDESGYELQQQQKLVVPRNVSARKVSQLVSGVVEGESWRGREGSEVSESVRSYLD